ncbi:MAG: hypothetical protein K9J81_07495, partial [Desulfohalobiaceae bacterium]|nr:hypothetical protein [Desulfohalobiaceae bacterium]
DAILCQITSKNISDKYAVPVDDTDFRSGHLKQSSNIRPNRLFTADTNIMLYRAGSITKNKLDQVIKKVIEIIKT